MNKKLSLTPSLQEKSLLRTNLDNCKFENNLCVLAENIPIAYSSKKFKLRIEIITYGILPLLFSDTDLRTFENILEEAGWPWCLVLSFC